jgi:ribosomal protein S18 acetylase RimI-like enzyme
MQVHPAELVDINFCCQINMSYTTDYVWQMRTGGDGRTVDIHFDTIRLPRPMRVEYPRLSDELIEHWQREECFLIIRGMQDEIIGFVDAQAQRWHNVLWVSNLVVDSRYRRKGFGSILLKQANRWAVEQNLNRLMLEVQTKNHPAIAFAQKHGFQFCGYNERYYPNGDIALFFSRPT